MRGAFSLLFAAGFVCGLLLAGENRQEMVLNDKAKLEKSEDWVYNDKDKALAEAKKTGKPLMVVMRCIPCHACKSLDEDVAQREASVAQLMDQFVCLRVVQANALDLTRYQFDYDMSWAVLFMNADGTIYARFGSKFEQKNGQTETSLKGLRRTLEAVLACHKAYPGNKELLAGKQPRPVAQKRPEEFPKLKTYGPNLDYAGNVVQSCLHCHQIRDAERELHRNALGEQILYPYPQSETIGFSLDPAEAAMVTSVEAGGIAAKAGLKPGDRLTELDGQAIYSVADVAWVLHQFKDGALKAQVERDGKPQALTIDLAAGWRRQSDLSWRASSWPLRRMALGGMLLEEVPADEKQKMGLAPEALALRAKHVGQYGAHALAKKAGFLKDDVIVDFNGQTAHMTESQLLGHVMETYGAGTEVSITILRKGQRKTIKLKTQ